MVAVAASALAALALLLAACGAASGERDRGEDATTAAGATLPPGVFLELAFPARGIRHRFLDDGRYLVVAGPGEPERAGPVLSRREGRRSDLSAAARERLLDAVRAAGFFDLDAELLPVEPVGRPPQTPRGASPRREPVVVRARDGSGAAAVTIAADPDWPSTLGPLRPIVDAMDVEAIGFYLDE